MRVLNSWRFVAQGKTRKLAPSRLAMELFCIDLEVPSAANFLRYTREKQRSRLRLEQRLKGTAMDCSDITRKRRVTFWLYGLAGAFMAPRTNENGAPCVWGTTE
jgi:hypothetical protein